MLETVFTDTSHVGDNGLNCAWSGASRTGYRCS